MLNETGEEEGVQSDGENEDIGEQTVLTKRRRLVHPLEMVYAHFERQQDDLQQAAALGKMLVLLLRILSS